MDDPELEDTERIEQEEERLRLASQSAGSAPAGESLVDGDELRAKLEKTVRKLRRKLKAKRLAEVVKSNAPAPIVEPEPEPKKERTGRGFSAFTHLLRVSKKYH